MTDEEPDDGTGGRNRDRAAARARIRQQQTWVDLQVQRAVERGEFDNLPGTGKPLDLGTTHDRDWWVRRMLEREQLTGLAPEAILLRTDDAELDARLDRLTTEQSVRGAVESFNARVIEARRQLMGGPPVITSVRDVDEEIRRWKERRERRRAARSSRQSTPGSGSSGRGSSATGRRRRWWRRSR